MALKVSKEQARYLLLNKQLLTDNPKSGYSGVEHVFNYLRIIQYDPLNPCGRNPDLVLQSRVDDYHPNGYYKWLYQERKGIECYDKELCIIPIEDFVLTSHNRKNAANHVRIKEFVKNHQSELENLITFIDDHGPTASSDVKNQKKIEGLNWFGTRWGRIALEALWRMDKVVIAKRVSGTKYYDLPHKIYDGDYFGQDQKVGAEHIHRRLGSVGILPASRFGSGSGWQGLGDPKHVASITKGLIGQKDLIMLEVEGIKTKYVILSDDRDLLNEEIEFAKQMRFIAPLDTLVWDRKMLENLFDFEYRWEVYVPAHKRKFGYYVLPILYRDRFVGQIEPVFKDNQLEIKGFWKEKGVVWDKKMHTGLDEAIERFRKYLRAKTVVWNSL